MRVRRLTLRREALSALTDTELGDVAGGLTPPPPRSLQIYDCVTTKPWCYQPTTDPVRCS